MNQDISRCSWCGKTVGDDGYVSKGGDIFCCEGCYLGYLGKEAVDSERNRMQSALAEALASALDAREKETGLHSKRVACHTLVLARRFSQDKEWLEQVYWGALLHDIGKIAMPDAVLLKEEALTESEWLLMQTHTQRGYEIIQNVPFMKAAAEIILCHEERYDGSGYPNGLKGDDIPLGARLFALIDTLDAMTSDRPYRQALSFESAKDEIVRMSDIQFDPKAVEAFLAEEVILREMVEMKCMVPREKV